MRTNIVIDDELMRRAMRASGARLLGLICLIGCSERKKVPLWGAAEAPFSPCQRLSINPLPLESPI
jgi:hypothetical protein